MTIGEVRSNGGVWVEVTVEGADGTDRTLGAVLDTGFTGYLALPPGEVRALGLAQETETRVTPANGETHAVATYQAPAALGSDLPSAASVVEIIEAGETLVGAGLLWGHDLRIQYAPGGKVEIERLA